ncbi:MAG: PspC domain-containing protein [Bacteroidales bacterium]|nr:PspC domain-containing protein [Bacteroidales bacterium]
MNKRLTRSYENKIFGGVCGGLGDYFESDPLLFRIIFLVLLFLGGSGFFFYLVMWIIIPQNQASHASFSQKTDNQQCDSAISDKNSISGSIFVGIIFIVLGSIFLFNNYISWMKLSKLWPLILVVIGLIMIIKYYSNNSNNNKKSSEHEEK